MSPQGYKNMDLESQDPIFNANLGQDKNLIWTKKLRCSHSMKIQEGSPTLRTLLRLETFLQFSETILNRLNPVWDQRSYVAQCSEKHFKI